LERVWTRVQKLSARAGQKQFVLRPKQEQLLQMLRDRRSMTPREIWDGLGVTRQGAIKLLQPLVDAGLVRRLGTRKTGRYVLRTPSL
jgi:DNA-binding MarR family transcriptional regulator